MRYLELLEFNAEGSADAAPASAPTSTGSKVYYHVTTKARLKSIQERGIEPNHPRRWKTGFRRQLGDRGNIYLMSDFAAAVRWAYKLQWEKYDGKPPDPSPFVIVCVRETPKNLQPDPHPENSLYGHSWFQKAGSIAPEDIMKVIPLTQDLIAQITSASAALGEGLHGVFSHFSRTASLRALADKGWEETTVPGMYRNPGYPEYSIDLDIHSPLAGPFTVFRGKKKLGVLSNVPYAQHLAAKDRIV